MGISRAHQDGSDAVALASDEKRWRGRAIWASGCWLRAPTGSKFVREDAGRPWRSWKAQEKRLG